MRTLLATLTLTALLATFGCSKKETPAADQTASTSTTASTQTPAPSEPAPAPAAAPAPAPAPPPEPQPIVVPAGTAITVTLGQALSSKTSQAGGVFTATVASPVSAGGEVAVPAKSGAQGTVVAAKAKGKVKGEGLLELQLTQLTIKGRPYAIQTSVWSQTEKGKGKRTAVTTGGGAAGGALIGGLAGGGKGAAIGAAVGAGAGFIGGAATGNKQIELPAEAALTFTLAAPLTIQ